MRLASDPAKEADQGALGRRQQVDLHALDDEHGQDRRQVHAAQRAALADEEAAKAKEEPAPTKGKAKTKAKGRTAQAKGAAKGGAQ